ncbi:uncharacterized protein LOC110725897 [Chenopodium quinoa]|uniref:uncharacterized protein LOC110725897 n=1 Tax=Chenopodium quinoa TaxID=63459 RepID=UPI000B787976|nr:uncharacterized protein LOC110725897 [Chenopodium quinoa]
MDAIGLIKPRSSAQHEYTLTATDYFTKWIEVQALKSLNARAVILLLEEKIFTRYGIPESINVDQATMFIGHEFNSYLKEFEIQKIHSTPYLATSKRDAIGTTPYQLAHGHEPVVPAELSAKCNKIAKQIGVSQEDYQQSMSIKLMDIKGERLQALAKIEAQKRQVAKSYNKKVKHKIFLEGI